MQTILRDFPKTNHLQRAMETMRVCTRTQSDFTSDYTWKKDTKQ